MLLFKFVKNKILLFKFEDMKRKKKNMQEMTNKFACDLFEGISLCSNINGKIFYEMKKLNYNFLGAFGMVLN